jgi:hypothetical protein
MESIFDKGKTMGSFVQGVVLIVLGVAITALSSYLKVTDLVGIGIGLVGIGIRHIPTDGETPPPPPNSTTASTTEKVQVTQTPKASEIPKVVAIEPIVKP